MKVFFQQRPYVTLSATIRYFIFIHFKFSKIAQRLYLLFASISLDREMFGASDYIQLSGVSKSFEIEKPVQSKTILFHPSIATIRYLISNLNIFVLKGSVDFKFTILVPHTELNNHAKKYYCRFRHYRVIHSFFL